MIAYLYSPSVDSLEDLQFKQARKEHEHIMNQFYEQELPDITNHTTDAAEDSTERLTAGRSKEKTGIMVKGNGVEKRRYMKKDPKEKAKEKLWESIIKETEDEASSSDSSDDEH